jgi:hypothetical protein
MPKEKKKGNVSNIPKLKKIPPSHSIYHFKVWYLRGILLSLKKKRKKRKGMLIMFPNQKKRTLPSTFYLPFPNSGLKSKSSLKIKKK